MAIRILSYHVQEMRVGFVVRLAHSVALVHGWVLPWVDKKVAAYYERKGK